MATKAARRSKCLGGGERTGALLVADSEEQGRALGACMGEIQWTMNSDGYVHMHTHMEVNPYYLVCCYVTTAIYTDSTWNIQSAMKPRSKEVHLPWKGSRQHLPCNHHPQQHLTCNHLPQPCLTPNLIPSGHFNFPEQEHQQDHVGHPQECTQIAWLSIHIEVQFYSIDPIAFPTQWHKC